MSINPVSFGKIFDIRYKQGLDTSKEQVEKRIENDKATTIRNSSVVFVDRVEFVNIYARPYGGLYPEGLRIFTDNSFRDYSMLKDIDSNAAEQFIQKEAKQFVITV